MKNTIITILAIATLSLSACGTAVLTTTPSVDIDHVSFNYSEGRSARAVKVDVIDNNLTPTFYIASERELADSTPRANFVLAPGLDIFDQDAVTAWVIDYTGIPTIDAVITCNPDEDQKPGPDGILNTADDIVVRGRANCSWF